MVVFLSHHMSLTANAARCAAKSVNVCIVQGHELFKKLLALSDWNVQTSSVINRCNIQRAPSRHVFSRYADTLSEGPALTSARLPCTARVQIKSACTKMDMEDVPAAFYLHI